MKKIETNRLKLAELRIFENRDDGIEISPILSYKLLVNMDGVYCNYFNMDASYPAFIKGDLRLSDVKEYQGFCYLVLSTNLEDYLGEETDNRTVEDYVLGSDLYFEDRIAIAKKRLKCVKKPLQMLTIIADDTLKKEEILDCERERVRRRNEAKVKRKDW